MGPAALEDLITAFARLPGIGRKTAQRLAFYLIKSPRGEAEALASAIIAGKDGIQYCTKCFNFCERGQDLCHVCREERRSVQVICVVEEASDVLVLERGQLIAGTYHVLGGALSPLDGVGRIYELNPTAARVWELLDEGLDRHQIDTRLAEEFDAESPCIAQQVDALIRQLEAAGLLKRDLEASAPPAVEAPAEPAPGTSGSDWVLRFDPSWSRSR